MKLWKRNAVVAAILLFVCVAVYLNWSYQQEGSDAEVGKTLGEAAQVTSEVNDPLMESSGTTENSSGSDYFSSARLNRQKARDSALALLEEAALSEGVEQTVIDEANASIQTMAAWTVTEAQIENLIMAKGYEDCVAFIGDESISIVVSALEGGLDSTATARITDIVMDETSFAAEQIKIIEAE